MPNLWEGLVFTGLTDSWAQVNSAQQTIDNLARTPLSKVLYFVLGFTIFRLAIAGYLAKTPAHQRFGAYGFVRFLNETADAIVYAGVVVFMLIRPFALQAFTIPSGSMWPTLNVADYIVANKAIYRFSDPKVGDIVVFRPPKFIVSRDQLDENGNPRVDYIKRCIGVPGDLIEFKNGQLYRNGQPVNESYRTFSKCESPAGMECTAFSTLTPEEVGRLTPVNFKLVKRGDEIIPLQYTDRDANSSLAEGNLLEPPPYVTAPPFVVDDPAEQRKLMAAPAQKIPPGYYLMIGDNRNGSFDGRAWGLVPRDAIVGRSEAIWFPLARWRMTR